MKDIRIGNDISVRWSLYKGDEAYDLTNLPVTLYLKNAYGKKEIKDYTIEGNQISWTFFGKDQKNTGKYSMVLVIHEGEQGMASTDYCDFVQLVSCACQVSGIDEENVQTETIELTSEVDFPPIIVDTALSESSLNAIANKAVAEKFAEVEGKMALQPDWNQSDPISKDYINNRTHGIVFHGDPRKSNYNDFLKSLTNPTIMHVGGNTIATFFTGYHSLYDYDTFLFQLNWGSTTDNILDGIIPTNQSVSVGASTSVVLTFRTLGSVTEDGEFVEHYQTIITFSDSEGWNVDEVISALCEQYCLLINEDFEIAKLDQRYIPETIARKSELLELSAEKEDKTNKVTSLTEESTDEQYPSAKAVYALSERISENEILIEDLQNTKIDKEADDYYPQLSVGLADNLSGVDVVDSDVNFRRSGGGAISDGVARIEAIKGNSVVWNQLYKPRKEELGTQVKNGVTFIVSEDGIVQAEGTADGASAVCELCVYADFKSSHKYILIAIGAPEGKWNRQGLYFSGSNLGAINTYTMIGSEGYKIFQPQGEGKKATITLTAWTGYSLSCSFRPQFYDLTQMFGAGNEPTTIEDFYARIPMGVDENAYNEGEVIHCDAQSIESQGVNAWDEEWENGSYSRNDGKPATNPSILRCKNAIAVLPNMTYHFNIPITSSLTDKSYMGYAIFYDSEDVFISSKPIGGTYYANVLTPTNARYMRFYLRSEYGTTYNHDICINLSDASINGKYFPYVKRTEDLSIIRKYFPQGMKSAGSAHDEIRYNKTTQKWEMVQRIGSVDMGTLNLSYNTINGGFFYGKLEGAETPSSWALVGNLLSGLYSNTNANAIAQSGATPVNMSIALAPVGTLHVVNTAYTDKATFKAAMQGVILYYELAEPIVTELDADDQFRDLDYQVWNCGTEKAIAEGKSSALAADITYGFNAIGKIKELESLVAALRAKVGI